MREGKALVFCSDRWDAKEFEKEHLKELQAIISVLGLRKDAYELTWANCSVEGIIKAPETKVVVTYGCLYKIQEIATKYEKLAIAYEKENDRFVAVKAKKDDSFGITSYTTKVYGLLG